MQKCTCRFSEPLDLYHPAAVNAPDGLGERNGQGRTQAYADKTNQHLSCVPPIPRELPAEDATDDMPLPSPFPRKPGPASPRPLAPPAVRTCLKGLDKIMGRPSRAISGSRAKHSAKHNAPNKA